MPPRCPSRPGTVAIVRSPSPSSGVPGPTSAPYRKYIWKQFDRWDLLASTYLGGDGSNWHLLLDMNPEIQDPHMVDPHRGSDTHRMTTDQRLLSDITCVVRFPSLKGSAEVHQAEVLRQDRAMDSALIEVYPPREIQ